MLVRRRGVGKRAVEVGVCGWGGSIKWSGVVVVLWRSYIEACSIVV